MSDAKVLWHDVITHTDDGELHRQSFGPEHVVPGTEKIIDLLPGDTAHIRRVRPQSYLQPGSYWVRHKGYKPIVIAHWDGEHWFHPGVSASDAFGAVEVMSDRLIPPNSGE